MRSSKYPELEAALARAGITKKQLAQNIGINARTLSYKLADGKLTKAELIAAEHILHDEMHPGVYPPTCISIPVTIGGKLVETITVSKK